MAFQQHRSRTLAAPGGRENWAFSPFPREEMQGLKMENYHRQCTSFPLHSYFIPVLVTVKTRFTHIEIMYHRRSFQEVKYGLTEKLMIIVIVHFNGLLCALIWGQVTHLPL